MIRPVTTVLATAAAVAGLIAGPVPAASAAGNLLRNPGFEQSLSSDVWKGQDCCVTTSDPHKGAWIAYMGSTGTPHTDTIRQKVTIPDRDDATLSFWLKISTDELAGVTDDRFTVKVLLNGKARTVKTLSSADGTRPLSSGAASYVKYSAAMSRYTGKTVVVVFAATEDQGDRTDFQLDDTRLRAF